MPRARSRGERRACESREGRGASARRFRGNGAREEVNAPGSEKIASVIQVEGERERERERERRRVRERDKGGGDTLFQGAIRW